MSSFDDQSAKKTPVHSLAQTLDQNRHYQLIEKAICWLTEHWQTQPELAQVAQALHCSEYHLQRVFKQWAGVSPKRFLQFLTKEFLTDQLKQQANILAASHTAGLSGSSRSHDLLVSCEALTPGEIKSAGNGLSFNYGTTHSPFGPCLIGWNERGISYLSFIDKDCEPEAELSAYLARAKWKRADQAADQLSHQLFATNKQKPIQLLVKGTNFQLKVWEALLFSQPASCLSYRQLAALIGQPTAARAVGNALAHNPVALLIPCHRVIKENAVINQYRWGKSRKQAILGWEYAKYSAVNR